MSNTESLPPYPQDSNEWTPLDVTYRFVWQKCTDEEPKAPTAGDQIRIIGPVEGAITEDTENAYSLPSTPDKDNAEPDSPKTEAINFGRANHYMPCTANFVWGKHHASFHCQYDPHRRRFCHFILSEKDTAPATLEDFEARDFQISHTPHAFHSNVLEGTAMKDDQENEMLFVKLDNSAGWNAQLYGKRCGPHDAKLTMGESDRLGLYTRFDLDRWTGYWKN